MCIHNNVLFGIKDVYNSMASVSSRVRSVLCTGPHHQYPVPLCFGLRLLRVLDALTIRFYEFPIEILKLFQLRYLACTYNGKLPASISELWNLQFLIVRRHLRIKSCGPPLYLPSEIWNMKELKHLQVMGSDLPHPPCGAILPNLLTLSDVTAHSCSKEVLEGIPNLKKLGIQIELALDSVEPLCSLDYLAYLHGLESLKCVILNPKPSSRIVAQTYPTSIFPLGLKKLTLSGFGYPWDCMNKIGELPNLEVLKLKCFTFRGLKWYKKNDEFRELKFLLIEDSDLEYWGSDSSFPHLQRLIIRHCYKLEEFPLDFKSAGSLEMIELIDCKPSVVESATFQQGLQVCLRSSWIDEKH
ncbi:hypothetical protein BUALT_Bualt02G0135800 [Buddleja alternifolia]|uniref:Disease resistance R13L4/SHOC-2-like LRR domain-containing protein n=1 Tax=Buddleja alternifolia TaxID=168488 RepID=A0AAV6Y7X9_9LAMI|nr:hypothetical protein BUALT_Bualt02G0135800 [Buddleja alternifolia]